MIDDLCRFLQGQTETIITALRRTWIQPLRTSISNAPPTIRDQIESIDRVVEHQRVISPEKMDSDVIAMARANGEACVQIFFIRGGKLIGREYFILEGTHDEADPEVVCTIHQAVLFRSGQYPSAGAPAQ